jgi:carboxyl-terminal processing protease
MSVKSLLPAILLLSAALATGPRAHAQSPAATISLEDRVRMATQIYHIISSFFPGLPQEKFDVDYTDYLRVILGSDDRREFDLASMEFVARLHDGHSWFYDNWLDQTTAQPNGFISYPLSGEWTVVRSNLDSVKVGDVITAIDATSIQDFFAHNRKYVSASSDRDAGVSFFDTAVVFPEKYILTLADGRRIPIDRKNDKKNAEPLPKTAGRWLVEKSVAYIKVPSFHGIETQAQALRYLEEFHDAKAVILDVRGNPGMGEPIALQSALMGKPYQSWTDSSSLHGGPLLRSYDAAYPAYSTITTSDAVVHPFDRGYAGRLILLTDRICSCACEDFVMPFKYSKRATLVGETTAGTFSFTRYIPFDNGMILNIAAIHHTFPDGSQFEGVGIAPDVPVDITPDDLRSGRDAVLKTALDLAQHP